jgi:hypothetical protein
METARTEAGYPIVMLLETVRAVLSGKRPFYNPDDDELVQELRQQRRNSILTTRELRKEREDYFPIADMVRENGRPHND